MATSLNLIRTVTVRAQTQGVDEAAASVGKLSSAQDDLVTSSAKVEKATLSADAALQKLQRRYDDEFKAQQDLSKVQATLDRAREQGLISQSRENDLMQLAIKAHNSAGEAAKTHSAALDELQKHAQESASHLGSLGTVLTSLGPVGLALAAGLGAITVGFLEASKAALELAEKAGKLVDLSDTVGLTVKEIQGLQAAGAGVGLSAEAVSAGLEKFSVSLGNIRAGTGSAVQALDRLSPGLVQQIQSAKTASEAFDLITKALGKMDSAEKSLVARDIFGKGGAGIGRLADLTAAAGGVDKLANSLNQIDTMTRGEAEHFNDLGTAINSNFAKAGQNVTSTFAGPVLESLKSISEILLDLSRVAKLVGEPLVEAFAGPALQALQDFKTELDGFVTQLQNLGDSDKLKVLSEEFIDPRLIQTVIDLAAVFKDLASTILLAVQAADRFSSLDFSGAAASAAAAATAFGALQASASQLGKILSGDLPATGSGVGLPSIDVIAKQADELPPKLGKVATAAQAAGKASLDYVDILKANVKALGDAATESEKYQLKVAELTKEYQEGKITADTYNRAIAAADPTMKKLKDAAGELGGALVSAFVNGKSAGEALNTTLKSIATTAGSAAVTKALSGDFSGAAVSGAISIGSALLSKLFGSSDDDKKQQEAAQAAQQAAEALKQAQDAFAGMTRQINEFTAAAQGTQIGDLTKQLADLHDAAVPLFDAAAKAQDNASFQAIGATEIAGDLRILTDFLHQIPDLIGEFGAQSGPIADARTAIKALMDQFESLNDSIQEFGRRTGDVQGTLQRSSDLQIAAVTAVLSTLDGTAAALSDTGQQIVDVKAKAHVLTDALVELGFSADDAASIIDTRLTAALQRISGSFLDNLTRQINTLAGGDWINQAQDLAAQVNQMRADAAALGIQTSLIDTFYVLSAQKIVDGAQLTGFAFDALSRLLGLAGTSLHAFSAAVSDTAAAIVRSTDEINKAIQTNQDRLFNALHTTDSLADQLARFDLQAQREREAEIVAGGQALASLEAAQAQERLNIITDFLQKQADAQKQADDAAAQAADQAQQQALDAAKQFADQQAQILAEAQQFLEAQTKRISDWINNFLSGPTSILPPSQQMATARANFASQLSLAQGGDRDALTNITTSAQQVLDSVRRYYGSSTAGQTIIQQLLASLQGLPGQLTAEEFIVNNLTPPINNVGSTVTSTTTTQTTTLSALLNNLKLAVESQDAQAVAVALLPLFNQLDTTMDQALTFAEFQAGLGSSFSSGTLKAIFDTLDLNGDQMLTQAELTAFATQGTAASVRPIGGIEDNTKTANDLLQTAADRIAAGTSENVLWLSQIWDKMTVLIQQTINNGGYLSQIAGWAPGSGHAMGGRITGGILGRDSVHAMLTPGEFVVRQSVARLNPWLENFNTTGMVPGLDTYGPAANDNSVVVAISRLERSLLRGIKAMIDTQLQAAGMVAEPMRESNKITKTRRGEKKVA